MSQSEIQTWMSTLFVFNSADLKWVNGSKPAVLPPPPVETQTKKNKLMRVTHWLQGSNGRYFSTSHYITYRLDTGRFQKLNKKKTTKIYFIWHSSCDGVTEISGYLLSEQPFYGTKGRAGGLRPKTCPLLAWARADNAYTFNLGCGGPGEYFGQTSRSVINEVGIIMLSRRWPNIVYLLKALTSSGTNYVPSLVFTYRNLHEPIAAFS